MILLRRWLIFLLCSLTVILSQSCSLDLFLFLLILVFILQWLSFHCKILIISVSQFPLTIHYTKKQDALFYRIAYDYFHADWDGLQDHLGDVPWEDIFKLSASSATSEFCEWFQVGIDVYIPHCKYQVKPHSSPWFSAACAAAIVHRNHFFQLYQHNKSFESKLKLRQASNH